MVATATNDRAPAASGRGKTSSAQSIPQAQTFLRKEGDWESLLPLDIGFIRATKDLKDFKDLKGIKALAKKITGIKKDTRELFL